MRFQRGDIVKNAPGWTAGCYVITGYNATRPKNCYDATHIVTGKRYRLSNDGIFKVGTASPEFFDPPKANELPEETIVNRIRNIDSQLSPENLACDGELTMNQIAIRKARLEADRATAMRELREVLDRKYLNPTKANWGDSKTP